MNYENYARKGMIFFIIKTQHRVLTNGTAGDNLPLSMNYFYKSS